MEPAFKDSMLADRLFIGRARKSNINITPHSKYSCGFAQ